VSYFFLIAKNIFNSIVPLIKRRITYRQWSIYKILWFNNCWSLSQLQPVSIYNNF